jgi:U6 snRNA phosphodiesterase
MSISNARKPPSETSTRADSQPGIPSSDDFMKLQKAINSFKQRQVGDQVHSFLQSDLGVHLPLHISLSAPLVLQTSGKDKFSADLKEAVLASGARAFTVRTTDLAWVPNSDRSRYFMVLKLEKPANDDLNKLLRACNTCANDWHLPLLYDQAGKDESSSVQAFDRSSAFHISVAWTLYNPNIDEDDTNSRKVSDDAAGIPINFDAVLMKIGNSVTQIRLSR